MKKIKFSIVLLTLGALTLNTTSCSDSYLDVNENPNSIPAENITPELMLPGALSTAYRTQAGTMMQFGNLMMNSWAGNSYAFGSPFSREFNLGSVDSSFYAGIWSGLYPRLANFAQIENSPNSDGSQTQYIAIAKIMKAYYMQYIVDLYGDVPYSQAFKGIANLTPAYDNDEDIYKALISSLEEANTLIDSGVGDTPASDIIFGGTMSSWKKLSNTIQLRLLLRMSNLTGSMATYRDAKAAALAGASFVDADVTINPGYSTSNNDQMNPFVLTWYRNSSIQQVQAYSLVTVSEHMANALEGNKILNSSNYAKFTGINDPRRARMFTTVTGAQQWNGTTYTGLKGIRQGAVPGQDGAPLYSVSVSRLGFGNLVGSNPIATWTDVVNYGNSRGGVIMSLAESNLLQAEASLRWPSYFSNGQTLFNAAITSHGAWLGASSAGVANYITAISGVAGLGWTGTDDQKIEAIMTQKWIALTNINPTEMFIEYNRTGLPWTPLATTASQPNKPYRLMYPTSEYAANSSNVPNIPQSAVFQKNQYTPFWNQ